MIVKIEKSQKPYKRFTVTMDNGHTFDFGYKTGSTYLDHKDRDKRYNYLKRHLANDTERKLIKNLVPSPSLFSAMLLWGPYTNVYSNIDFLNRLWAMKHSGVNFDFFEIL